MVKLTLKYDTFYDEVYGMYIHFGWSFYRRRFFGLIKTYQDFHSDRLNT